MKLSAKMEAFCREYAVSLNATQAALRAGYSKRTAKEMGCENLSKPHIQARIAELRKDQEKRTQITGDMVVAELAKLGFYNVNDFIGDDNSIEKLKQMERDKTAPVVGIKVTERFFGDEKIVTTEIKLADKNAALEKLGRHLGIFERDNKQKGSKITISRK